MIVNARMYSVAPAAKAAWRELLEWVLEHANVQMQFVDQEPPATLADLWGRSDLGCAMMCGLPYSHRTSSYDIFHSIRQSADRHPGVW